LSRSVSRLTSNPFEEINLICSKVISQGGKD
jgi:hypothetical protein